MPFKALKVMGKLKDFLTDKNLELLDIVLQGLTDPKQAAFNTFWQWFATQKPNDVGYAAGRLEALREILREYRGA